jgi:hypothetical protein
MHAQTPVAALCQPKLAKLQMTGPVGDLRPPWKPMHAQCLD